MPPPNAIIFLVHQLPPVIKGFPLVDTVLGVYLWAALYDRPGFLSGLGWGLGLAYFWIYAPVRPPRLPQYFPFATWLVVLF